MTVKKIVTEIPKEWKLMIEETKALANGILVFSTKLGFVFVRVMSYEEILECEKFGILPFEILNPIELKAMGFSEERIKVQESYIESQIGKKKAYVVEE